MLTRGRKSKRKVTSKVALVIRERREELGLSQMDLARALKLKSPQFISNIERGLVNIPLKKIDQFCRVLQLDYKFLLKLVHEEKIPQKLRKFLLEQESKTLDALPIELQAVVEKYLGSDRKKRQDFLKLSCIFFGLDYETFVAEYFSQAQELGEGESLEGQEESHKSMIPEISV
jgi:transcriptional regulator with XRE-family HTH domain